MKTLRQKITQEEITLYKLKKLGQSGYMSLKKHVYIYSQIDERKKKINFLRNLRKSLEKVENDRTNKMDQK